MILTVTVRALALSALALCVGGPAAQIAAPEPMTLIYVGAEDCQPCKIWQRGDGDLFRRSPLYERLVYREVRSPTLFDVMNDEYWPEDLRELRGALDRSSGVPLWIVKADQRIVLRAQGLTEWKTRVLPILR
jgi:hypothetical protein